jgi:allantoinase
MARETKKKSTKAVAKQSSATDWTWPGGKRLALSIVVNVEEGSEMSLRDGDKGPEPVDELGVSVHSPIRNYGNESNYQYGIREGFPRIARALDAHGIRATFTAAAQALERAPHIAEYIREGGHEACSHGWRWVHQFKMDEAAEREFIRKAVHSIDTEHTRRLLQEEGFLYHMDDYSADVPFWSYATAKPMVIVPYALDSNDMKFWLAPGYDTETWLQYAIDTFETLFEEGMQTPRMMSLGLHLRIIGRPGRILALQQFLSYVSQFDDVWITTRRDIAEHFAKNCPAKVVNA